MNQEQLKQHYLSKVKESEELAAHCTDPHYRERWLSIAEGYRILARSRQFERPVDPSLSGCSVL
jgi:hypothetical protein